MIWWIQMSTFYLATLNSCLFTDWSRVLHAIMSVSVLWQTWSETVVQKLLDGEENNFWVDRHSSKMFVKQVQVIKRLKVSHDLTWRAAYEKSFNGLSVFCFESSLNQVRISHEKSIYNNKAEFVKDKLCNSKIK